MLEIQATQATPGIPATQAIAECSTMGTETYLQGCSHEALSLGVACLVPSQR